MNRRACAFGSILLALAACSKPDAKGSGGAPSATPSTSASDSAKAAGAGSAPTTPAATRHFTGKYTSAAGTIFVPDGGEWSGTKWRGDESKEGLGDGEISIDVDGEHAHGSLGGPLGPAMIDGVLSGDHLTAHIARHDPHDGGFTGTLDGALAQGAIKGSMRLSRATADVIRDATFEIAAK